MAKKNMGALDWIAIVLVFIGAIHLGLMGLGVDLVTMITGSMKWLWIVIHELIFASAIYGISRALYKAR